MLSSGFSTEEADGDETELAKPPLEDEVEDGALFPTTRAVVDDSATRDETSDVEFTPTLVSTAPDGELNPTELEDELDLPDSLASKSLKGEGGGTHLDEDGEDTNEESVGRLRQSAQLDPLGKFFTAMFVEKDFNCFTT